MVVDEEIRNAMLKDTDPAVAARVLDWVAAELTHREVPKDTVAQLKAQKVGEHDAFVVGHTTAIFEIQVLVKMLKVEAAQSG